MKCSRGAAGDRQLVETGCGFFGFQYYGFDSVVLEKKTNVFDERAFLGCMP